MVYHGKGFTFTELYTMPTYLRNYYLKQMLQTRKEENEKVERESKRIKK